MSYKDLKTGKVPGMKQSGLATGGSAPIASTPSGNSGTSGTTRISGTSGASSTPKRSRKKLWWLVAAACVAVPGVIMAVTNGGGSADKASEAADIVAAEVERVPITLEAELPSKTALADAVSSYPDRIDETRQGRDWTSAGAQGQPLRITGTLGVASVKIDAVLTNDGRLKGRFYNDNGIMLDLNGIVAADAGIKLMLGHGKEQSEASLSPVTLLADRTAVEYSGTWGRQSKPMRLFISSASAPDPIGFTNDRRRAYVKAIGNVQEGDYSHSIRTVDLRLPVYPTGNLVGETSVAEIMGRKNSSLDDAIEAFIMSPLDNEKVMKLGVSSSDIPEYADAAQGRNAETIAALPAYINNKFIVMRFTGILDTGSGTGAGVSYVTKSYPLLIGPDPNFPKGYIAPEDIVMKSNNSRILPLINKQLQPRLGDDVTSPAERVPDNVELCPTGVLFRFEKYEISYGAAGEVEAIVPYYEIRNYLRPAVRELLEQTHGWTECGRDD